jgi:hypothetical protein
MGNLTLAQSQQKVRMQYLHWCRRWHSFSSLSQVVQRPFSSSSYRLDHCCFPQIAIEYAGPHETLPTRVLSASSSFGSISSRSEPTPSPTPAPNTYAFPSEVTAAV